MRDADIGRLRRGRDGAPGRVAPFGMRLLALEVERRLRVFEIDARGGQERDARIGQSFLERRPDRRGLAGKGPAPFIEGAEAPRQELEAVDDHQSKSRRVPVITGRTAPPTSMRAGSSSSPW